MNEKKMVSMRVPKEGLFQMLNGRMGSFATLVSQYQKAAKWRTETTRRAISYGSSQPARGAWLRYCQHVPPEP
jgi:hypothetical protein